MKKIVFLLTLYMLSVSCFPQDYRIFQKKLYIKSSDTIPYRLLYPMNFDSTKRYPLIVFLHGAGHRGKDNQKQLTNGAALFMKEANRKMYPAFVLFPQCSLNDFWARTRIVKAITDSTPFQFEYRTDVPMNSGLYLVSLLLDSMASSKNINAHQIYAGGLSMGGMGTFELLWRKPMFFAAAFPMSGGGNTSKVIVYAKDFPIWIFHGDKDPVVDVNDSRKMAKALKAAGAKVKYTEYLNIRHDSWTRAFAEPELLPWLFSQRTK